MKVIYSDKAQQGGEGNILLQEATKRLDEVIGPSADRVTAEWDRKDENGHPLYTLRISDQTESATASLAPDELASPKHLRVRLYQLWDDVLQERSHKQLKRLLDTE